MLLAFCRRLFVVLVAWPLTFFWLGFALRHKERLPKKGPAIIIANHNSHLDTFMLLTFFPLARIPDIRIAAAEDYFFASRRGRFLAKWFFGLVPVHRGGSLKSDSLKSMAEVLARGQILILYPEGTRGEPDVMSDIKPGLWHLARRFPGVPICPVYMHGLARSLPKGSRVPVPLFADVFVGEPLGFLPLKKDFAASVAACFARLREQTLAALAPLDEDCEYEDARPAHQHAQGADQS
ncbi:1-acyl-sn-glycerol-3-phosphate acyltransferase [Desulfovibrio sp. OttesenSCG-928-A18]|nr:1-acyl-sn-glycerol-3-phosphate acyltransferase [Desulfovibrio sp. OttesenSCG-928-A18]